MEENTDAYNSVWGGRKSLVLTLCTMYCVCVCLFLLHAVCSYLLTVRTSGPDTGALAGPSVSVEHPLHLCTSSQTRCNLCLIRCRQPQMLKKKRPLIFTKIDQFAVCVWKFYKKCIQMVGWIIDTSRGIKLTNCYKWVIVYELPAYGWYGER